MNNDIRVTWRFRNDHEWHRVFDTVPERDLFINTVGLVTHPDIVRVVIQEGDFTMTLKG